MNEKTLTRVERKRRSEIIRELSDLSRDGWSRARFDDYHPLEVELAKLDAEKDLKP